MYRPTSITLMAFALAACADSPTAPRPGTPLSGSVSRELLPSGE